MVIVTYMEIYQKSLKLKIIVSLSLHRWVKKLSNLFRRRHWREGRGRSTSSSSGHSSPPSEKLSQWERPFKPIIIEPHIFRSWKTSSGFKMINVQVGSPPFKPCFHLKLDTGTYGNQLCKVPAESYLDCVVPWTKIVIGCCSWSFFNKLLRKILRRRCIGRDLWWKCIFSGSTLTIPENIGTHHLGNELETLREGISYWKKRQLWWGLLFLQLPEQVLHPVLPSFPSSALYSTKVSGRPTFHWTLGFRRCLRNCKIPPVDQSFIKTPGLAKSFSNAVPSRLQGFCTTFKVLPTWWFQFRRPELEARFTLFSFRAFAKKPFPEKNFMFSRSKHTKNFAPTLHWAWRNDWEWNIPSVIF